MRKFSCGDRVEITTDTISSGGYILKTHGIRGTVVSFAGRGFYYIRLDKVIRGLYYNELNEAIFPTNKLRMSREFVVNLL